MGNGVRAQAEENVVHGRKENLSAGDYGGHRLQLEAFDLAARGEFQAWIPAFAGMTAPTTKNRPRFARGSFITVKKFTQN